jgi:extracellular factor (EF) 3-hydroxypalmitic acid methyl ester biosynthesis protein
MLPKMSSQVTSGNGNGKGGSPNLLKPAKGAVRETAAETRDLKGSLAVFKTRDGAETRGTILRLGRYAVAFELYQTAVVLRTSEVLDKFKILIDGRMIYSGRAVVGSLIDAGSRIICEVKLDDLGTETDFFLQPSVAGSDWEQAYGRFFRQWQKNYRVSAEFKVLVTDIQAFLVATRQWLEQVEFDLGTSKDSRLPEHQMETLEAIARRVIAAFNAQHEKFEDLAYAIPEEHYGAHQEFVRRHWQQLFLCSPFGQRTFYKPLGYAGDYEMMNMIHRNQPEGGSLYEKLIHFLLVSQWPAQSVRNRVAHLKNHILQETARVARLGRRARILNVGCGPAREVQDFLAETPLANETDFVLVDFNEETLDYVKTQINRLKGPFSQQATVETRQVSVHHLLRQNAHPEHQPVEPGYDLIYCGGLFDYLSEPTCRSLVNLFYDWLRPGGLAVVANMSDAKPFRNFIEFVLDWQLIYRDSGKMLALAPERARDTARVITEPTSVNLFLHLVKPD